MMTAGIAFIALLVIHVRRHWLIRVPAGEIEFSRSVSLALAGCLLSWEKAGPAAVASERHDQVSGDLADLPFFNMPAIAVKECQVTSILRMPCQR
jgi:hypothetical protein